MKAIDLFPYWSDNRALLAEATAALGDGDLDFRPAPALRSVGDVLRHIITTKEHWWHGGIHGKPYADWRAVGWERFTDAEREESRRRRFTTVPSILEGLEIAHAPLEGFLKDLDAADLCEKRQATWGQQNTLRWIVWHLVEHDQHHRAQIFARLRMLGHTPPPIWPRPRVMGHTPAGCWRDEVVDPKDIVPFWKPLHASLRDAVSALSDADLTFSPAPGQPTVHDLVLHLFIQEDFLIRQVLAGETGRPPGKIQGGWGRVNGSQLSAHAGPAFPTVAALLEGMDAVHAATRQAIDRMTVADLVRTYPSPAGPEAVHHIMWYAREHAVHHRAQLFLRMRMLGRTPPEV